MAGDSPPLDSGERHCWMRRSCGGRTGLTYSSIAMMEKFNELKALLMSVTVVTVYVYGTVPPQVLWPS